MASHAKLDVNTATRDELVNTVGLRPQLADAIIKFRESDGPITDLAMLDDVSGVGAATIEQMKAHLGVATKSAQHGTQAGSAESGADAAKKATETGAETTARVAEAGAARVKEAVQAAPKPADVAASMMQQQEKLAAPAIDAARSATTRVADATLKAVETTAPVADDLSRFWLQTVNDQVEDGVATLKGMVAARNVRDLVELQSRFMSGSISRMTQLSTRYFVAMGKLTGDLTTAGRKAA